VYQKKRLSKFFLTENMQSKTLSLMEEARSFRIYVKERGWGGISELASLTGKSISYISRRLNLLEMSKDILDIVGTDLNVSAAEELITIKNKEKQSELAKIIARHHLTIRNIKKAKDYDTYLDQFNSEEYMIRVIDSKINKTINVLKITKNKINMILETTDKNCMIYDLLNNVLSNINEQISYSIKTKNTLLKQIKSGMVLCKLDKI
jgi:transcriptional regulator with XRE-family HTH domain